MKITSFVRHWKFWRKSDIILQAREYCKYYKGSNLGCYTAASVKKGDTCRKHNFFTFSLCSPKHMYLNRTADYDRNNLACILHVVLAPGSDRTLHPQTQRMSSTKMCSFLHISPTSQLIRSLQKYSSALTIPQTSSWFTSFCPLCDGTRQLWFGCGEEVHSASSYFTNSLFVSRKKRKKNVS